MLCFAYLLVLLFLVVSTSAIDCLERVVSKMTYYVSSGMLNLHTHPLGLVVSIFDISCLSLALWNKLCSLCGFELPQTMRIFANDIICSGGKMILSCLV